MCERAPHIACIEPRESLQHTDRRLQGRIPHGGASAARRAVPALGGVRRRVVAPAPRRGTPAARRRQRAAAPPACAPGVRICAPPPGALCALRDARPPGRRRARPRTGGHRRVARIVRVRPRERQGRGCAGPCGGAAGSWAVAVGRARSDAVPHWEPFHHKPPAALTLPPLPPTHAASSGEWRRTQSFRRAARLPAIPPLHVAMRLWIFTYAIRLVWSGRP